jgi:hypothetical protein
MLTYADVCCRARRPQPRDGQQVLNCTTHFTYFTSAKVHILTHQHICRRRPASSGAAAPEDGGSGGGGGGGLAASRRSSAGGGLGGGGARKSVSTVGRDGDALGKTVKIVHEFEKEGGQSFAAVVAEREEREQQGTGKRALAWVAGGDAAPSCVKPRPASAQVLLLSLLALLVQRYRY